VPVQEDARLILGEPSLAGVVLPRRQRDRQLSFIARSIAGITETVERAIFNQEFASRDGFLQRIDPRAKVAGLLLVIMATALARNLVIVVALYAVALGLALLSKVPLWFFVKRVWLGVPLFTGFVILPALLTIPGVVILPLVEIGPVSLAVTDQSLAFTALFVARVGTSVSLAVLLVVTTRWADLLKSLQVLGVPEAFVAVLGMTYRYIFLFLHLITNLLLARRSRTIGETSGGEKRRWVAASMGALLGKSFKLSDDVHQAMRSRGFQGKIRTVSNFQMGDLDWLFIAAIVLVSASALLIDLRLA
jgi:cobalt/nickel transport system permease protein